MKSKKNDFKKYKKKKSKRRKTSILLGGSTHYEEQHLPIIFDKTNDEYVRFINTLKLIYPGKKILEIINIEIKSDKTVQRGSKRFYTGITSTITLTEDAVMDGNSLENCNILSQVNIADNVELPEGFFKNSSIRKINILGYRNITFGKQCFMGCGYLRTLNIPKGVLLFDECFSNCQGLSILTFTETDNRVFSYLGNKCFYQCNNINIINFNDCVNTLGNNCFRDCTSLENVDLKNSILSVGEGCFRSCRNLTTVTLGEDLKKLPALMFYECNKLKNIKNLKNIEEIDYMCFGHSGIEKINFNENAKLIFNRLQLERGTFCNIFVNCFLLNSVILPECVVELPENLFRNCAKLENLTVDFSKINIIGGSCFRGCTNLKNKITLSETELGVFAFRESGIIKVELNNIVNIPKGLLHLCPNLTKVIINGTKTINIEEGFTANCDDLRAVKIPDTVRNIGSLSFNSCFKIRYLILPKELEFLPPTLFYKDNDAFVPILFPLFERRRTRTRRRKLECLFISKDTILNTILRYTVDQQVFPFSRLGDVDEQGLKVIFYGVFENFEDVKRVANHACLKGCHKIFEWKHDECIVRGIYPAERKNRQEVFEPSRLNPIYLRFIDKIRFHTLSGSVIDHTIGNRKTLEEEKEECQKIMDRYLYNTRTDSKHYPDTFDYTFPNLKDLDIKKELKKLVSESRNDFFQRKKSGTSPQLKTYLSYNGYNHIADPERNHIEYEVLERCIRDEQNGTIKLINDVPVRRRFFTIQGDANA